MMTFTTWQKTIKQLMADQRAIRTLTFTAQDTATAASSAIELYKHLKHAHDEITAEIEESMKQAKGILADILTETNADRIEAPAGVAYIPKPGTTITYNVQALDLLCNSDPDMAAKLAPFRQTRARPGALTIR